MALTGKQQRFAELMALGDKDDGGKMLSMTEAYRRSYNAECMKPAVVRNEASKLMAHHDIAMTISRLRSRKEQSITAAQLSDRDRVLSKLRDMMDTAEAEAVQLNAAVWLGKSTAAFTDVSRDDTPQHSAAEIQAEIQRMLDEADNTQH